MTTVTFFTEDSRITGFTISGHSGYAEEGSDIVCAAVTSALRLTEATINDVFGLAASVRTQESIALISFRLPGGLSEYDEHAVQGLLAGLMLYFSVLHEEYPENIEVLES